MKFTKQFKGVKDGEIYPVTFEAGEDCPPDLEAAAIEAGAVKQESKPDSKPEQAKAKKHK